MATKVNISRTIFHVCGGLFATFIALIFPFPEIVIISGTFFMIAVIIEIRRNHNLPFHEDFIRRFAILMKPTEQGTVLGFTWVVGAALLLTLLQDFRPMVIGMLIWSFADPMAMLAGCLLPHPKTIMTGKTLEGSIAFFLTATLVSALFLMTITSKTPVLVMAPVIGLSGAIVELLSRKIRIDDNFSIPLITGMVTYFFVI